MPPPLKKGSRALQSYVYQTLEQLVCLYRDLSLEIAFVIIGKLPYSVFNVKTRSQLETKINTNCKILLELQRMFQLM